MLTDIVVFTSGLQEKHCFGWTFNSGHCEAKTEEGFGSFSPDTDNVAIIEKNDQMTIKCISLKILLTEKISGEVYKASAEKTINAWRLAIHCQALLAFYSMTWCHLAGSPEFPLG